MFLSLDVAGVNIIIGMMMMLLSTSFLTYFSSEDTQALP